MNITLELESFLKLPKGWHYGSGVPISKVTTDIVSELNEVAENYGLVTEVFPGVDGEVLLSIYGWEENALEVTVFFNDIEYRIEQNDETIEFEEFVSVEDIYVLINNLASVEV